MFQERLSTLGIRCIKSDKFKADIFNEVPDFVMKKVWTLILL